MTLAKVTTFLVPEEVKESTQVALQSAGSDGFELFVLWSGTLEGDVFTVRTTHVPEQQSYRLQSGVCVRVGGDALHRLNVWLLEHRERLAVQVHTHPHKAYHSATDDAFPIVTAIGGLSLVTPDFCRRGLLSAGYAIYRLRRVGWALERGTILQVV